MGGIGKTELALRYIDIYKDYYLGSLCWFSVREQKQLIPDFADDADEACEAWF